MIQSRSVGVLAVFVMLLSGLVGCSGFTPAQSQPAQTPGAAQPAKAPRPAVFKIGAMLPMTGAAAISGEYMNKGASLAIEQLNAAGGINGVPLQLVVEDIATDPKLGVSAINKMITVDQISATLTALSNVSLAAAPVAEKNKVVMLNGGGVSPNLAKASPYLLNNIPLSDQQAKVMLNHAVKDVGIKTIAIYYRNDDQGVDLNELLGNYIPKIGATFLGGASFDSGATDHSPQLARLKAMNPDAVYIAAIGNEPGTIIHQAAAVGFKPQWLGYSGMENAQTLKIAGNDGEGLLYTVPSTLDANGKMLAAAETFYADFLKKHNVKPEQISHVALGYYEGIKLIAAAILAVDSAGQPVNGENVRKMMLTIKDFNSVYGNTQFTSEGLVAKPIAIKTLKNGKFEYLKLYPVAEVLKM